MLRLHYVPGGHGSHDFGHRGRNGATSTQRRGTGSTNVARRGCRDRRDRFLMLGLHYVPGSHGSHGSQKRSSPWCFSHFCLCVQVLLSLTTFSHGLSRSAVTEARRRATVCHGWFYVSSRPVTFCWDLLRFVTLRSSSATSIKFCQGFLR